MENGRAIAYFWESLTDIDFQRFGFARGDAAGQQTWEALAILIALRLWSGRWKKKRVVLTVRSDSVSALVILLKFKTKGVMPGLIAREIALDVGESVYRPQVISHLPGIMNVVADKLSRFAQTGSSGTSLPSVLDGATRWIPPPRDDRYFRTLSPPIP